jgi:hypothetical protein
MSELLTPPPLVRQRACSHEYNSLDDLYSYLSKVMNDKQKKERVQKETSPHKADGVAIPSHIQRAQGLHTRRV